MAVQLSLQLLGSADRLLRDAYTEGLNRILQTFDKLQKSPYTAALQGTRAVRFVMLAEDTSTEGHFSTTGLHRGFV